MNRISFLLLFFLFAQLGTGYAQGDYFAPIGATWYHDRTGHNGDYWGYKKSTAVKDSVIQGRACRVISSMILEKSHPAPIIDTMYQEVAMIVYSTPDTVFYFNKSIERFIPLYIFNVNEGDTISYRTPYTIPNHPDFPTEDTIFRILITDVGNTDVGGVPLKTVSYTPLDMWGFTWGGGRDGYYIEKIGTRGGLLSHEPQVTYTGGSYPPSLRCYDDGAVNFTSSSLGDRPCDYIEGYTSISNSPFVDKLQIYPNPATDYVTIRNNGDHSITSIGLYDVVGRKVKTVPLRPDPVNIISITDLQRGNYLLKIKSSDQFINRKLIVH